ncbi:MAG TPA: lipoprotein [Alphaproteobacteria bacterium]|nr:lipoprotein [Alphaproteobacteria bacterium]
MIRLVFSIVLSAVVACTLAACGKKGPPEVPKGETDTLDRKYPSGE